MNSLKPHWPAFALPDMTLLAGTTALPVSDYFADIDPCTGQAFADIPAATTEHVNRMVEAAHTALHHPDWRAMAPLHREKLLHRWADLIEQDLPRLAALEARDTGKPLSLAEAVDVPTALNWLRTYAGWPTKLAGKSTALAGCPDHFHAYTRREPVGVVAAITPWNFPMVLAMWKLAPALAAGCTVILKPAPESPLSAFRLAELARQAGFPPGVFAVITGAGDIGAALASHPRVRKVAFTGSTATGQKILQASIPDLKRLTLELGGKSPSIICADANLERAIPEAAMACFFNSGQVCYAGTRLYVQRSRYEQVLEGIASHARQQRLGPSWDRSSQLGPLISAQHHAKVSAMLARAEAAGISVVGPVQTVPDTGYYCAPRIYRDVPATAEIAREEIFGPVLVATPFDDIDEAIALANDSDFGLGAHVWSNNLSETHELARRLDVGSVFVNCVLMADPALPFGGMKRSGLGRENGAEVFAAYLEPKSVVIGLR